MSLFKIVRQVKTYMEIVEQISTMIRTQVLLPGDQLPSERSLSKELGTGRQCLREALSVLEALGLIEVKMGRGTFVREDALSKLLASEFDVEKSGDPFALMETRKTLEIRTASLAAKRALPKDISDLDAVIAEMTVVAARGEHAGEQDKMLHLTIARASQNPVLAKLMSVVIENMGTRLWRVLKERSLLVAGRNERYYEEHVKLVDAIKQGNSKLAEKIMLKHLTGIENDLRS